MDRLSNLPDQILNHIVSLLPTKEALRTSLLSSQWKHISSSLPNLDFIHKAYISNSNLRNCVHKTLSSHDETDLESLSLKFLVDEKYVTSADLSTWVNIALKNKIRRFYLTLYYYKEPLNLPCEFFQCDTLQILSLGNCKLQMPSRIRFSNLRTLGLHAVDFPDYRDDIDVVNKLFHQTTLPVLEVLDISSCRQFHTICISIPSLVELQMYSHCKHRRVFVSVPSLRDISYYGCHLEVCSKTLASLKRGMFEFPIILNRNTDASDLPNTFASDILFGLCNIETLCLNPTFIESLSVDQLFFEKSPILSATLKHLHLEIHPTKKQFQVTRFLLQCFPKLQGVYISNTTFVMPEDKVAEDELVLASDFYFEGVSKLPILETIEVNYFGGTEAERDLILDLLQRASDLTKVNINYKPGLKESQITDIEKLVSLPRGSV